MQIRWLLLVWGATFIVACTHLPTAPEIKATDTVRTLTTGMSISMHTKERGISARGYLIYRHPDFLRLLFTSPFGATIAELTGTDDNLSIIIPGKHVVYSGNIRNLNPQSPLRNWRRFIWVIKPLTESPNRTGAVDFQTPDSITEAVMYDSNGFVTRKTTASGDVVQYKAYHLYNGVAVPDTIEFDNGHGDTIKLTFEDPEVNQPLDGNAEMPDTIGYESLPLEEFKGL